MWEPGTKLLKKHNPELGVGVVVGVDGRFIDVFFPDTITRMKLSPDPASVQPIVFAAGDVVKTPDGGLDAIVDIDGAYATLLEGDRVPTEQLWPVVAPPTLLDRMLHGELSSHEHVLNRIDGIRLLDFRRQGLIPSLIGGRIELFAHQLDTALRAIQKDQVRWLLADEVGLGKTIVAHMMTSAMLRMNRIQSVVIIAPDTLTVQWLGELYRKFHQVFVHIDEERIDCVRTDFGYDVNPFEVHPLAVVSTQMLHYNEMLLHSLHAAAPDLIVVDEAHQLLQEEIKPKILPVIEHAPHALLLTATPFQLGEDGFMELVSTLRLEHHKTAAGHHAIKGVSAVTRADIPALPMRCPNAIKIDAEGDLGTKDPRILWLIKKLHEWRKEEKKALIFVRDASEAQHVHETLTQHAHMELFLFHEDMHAKDRDIELSRFRLAASPALISSGAGSEGRNFQFCDILVHLNLPEDPTVLEQRIGRLDRIGREGDIPIYYFIHEGKGSELVRAYEELGIFEDASVGSSPAMSLLRAYLMSPERDPKALDKVLLDVREAMVRHEAQWLFLDSHQSGDGDAIFDDFPEELDGLIERFCVDAADRVGLEVVEKDGMCVYFFEYGAQALVDTIPGLPDDARYLGTFDREEAVQDQDLDFFSNGHPLLEGLLAELEDSEKGRVGCARLSRARVTNTSLATLNFGLYVLVVLGKERRSSSFLLHIQDGEAKRMETVDGDEVLEALEWSKPMPREVRKAARKTVRACKDLMPLADLDLNTLVMLDLTR